MNYSIKLPKSQFFAEEIIGQMKKYNKFVNNGSKKLYVLQKEYFVGKNLDLLREMIYNFVNNSKGAVG